MRRYCSALLLGMLTVTASIGQEASNPAAKPVSRPEANWQKRHQSFVQRAKEGKVDVLFIGDSITQGWEGNGKSVWSEKISKWNAANFGIGGDRTQHVLWRITEGKELEGINPKVVVMMIGTNNFGTDSPDHIAEGVAAILASFKQQRPYAKILLLGVFPRSAKPGREIKDVPVVPASELHAKTKAVNERLAKMADGKTVTYLDIGSKFLNEEGGLPRKIMPDFLHLSSEGYAIWADAIQKPVQKLLENSSK